MLQRCCPQSAAGRACVQFLQWLPCPQRLSSGCPETLHKLPWCSDGWQLQYWPDRVHLQKWFRCRFLHRCWRTGCRCRRIQSEKKRCGLRCRQCSGWSNQWQQNQLLLPVRLRRFPVRQCAFQRHHWSGSSDVYKYCPARSGQTGLLPVQNP